MQSVLLWMAASACLVTFAVHLFVGGAYVAHPLLADKGLPKASKWLNYYCWHITTVVILTMAGAFAYAALNPDRLDMAVWAAGLALALAILSALVALKGHIHPLRFPSTSLFALVAVLGWFGLA